MFTGVGREPAPAAAAAATANEARRLPVSPMLKLSAAVGRHVFYILNTLLIKKQVRVS
jgi:hypothetical protein